jgi:regulator of RNase E activity RraA
MAVIGEIGFRIFTGLPRPDPDLVRGFRGMASSNLSDAMGRFHFMDPGIVSRTGFPLCGPAVTVNARPGDNLMVHKALEVAEKGDVIVVSTNGGTTSAIFGELMCHSALAAGLGGLVVDGAVRDVEGITALGLPVFSRSVCPGACDKDGPGEVNVPISCGNTVVMPGDIIVGDADGVAVVPQADAAQVLERVASLVESEAKRIEAIQGGAVFKPEINETLRRKGILK